MLHESRVFKISETLIQSKLFDEIFLVGLQELSLSEHETLEPDIFIHRMLLWTRKLPKNLVFQPIKYIEFSLKVYLKYRNRNIGVVNIHHLSLLPLGFILKHLLKAKLIYDTHELETETQGLRGLKKMLAKILEKLLIRKCDKIFVVNESIAKFYAQMYSIDKPVAIMNVPHYVETKNSSKLRDFFRLKNSTVIFLYQGALSKNRGIELMIESFKGLYAEDCVLIFMGNGQLSETIRETNKTHENILYHPAVPVKELLNYTSSADYGINGLVDKNSCLSYYYSLPNKLFEYLMAELPIIVPNVPEMSNIVNRHRVGYIIEKNSVLEVQRVIRCIVEAPSPELNDNVLSAKKIFKWERQQKLLIEEYLDLIK